MPTSADAPYRIHTMDGLRGVAAFIVVIHHALLVSPTLVEEYRSVGASNSAWVRLAVDTPLHLLWGGGEAVTLFFVLSGMALALPLLSGRPKNWLAYYPRRMIRLYFPVWAALAFAIALLILVPRAATEGGSWWLNKHDVALTPNVVGHDVTLIFGTSFVNGPLWSLRWEVLFSLALPLYFYLGKRIGSGKVGGPLMAALLLVLIGVGSWSGILFLRYLPVFGFGILLAVNREIVSAWLSKLSPRSSWLSMAAGLFALTGQWIPYLRDTYIAMPLTSLGASLIVALVVWRGEYSAVGSSKLILWLGGVSFSLYLVHEPILMSVAFILPKPSAAAVLVIGLPLALGFAWIFHLLIEGPANTLSRHVGRVIVTAQQRYSAESSTAAREVPRHGDGS